MAANVVTAVATGTGNGLTRHTSLGIPLSATPSTHRVPFNVVPVKTGSGSGFSCHTGVGTQLSTTTSPFIIIFLPFTYLFTDLFTERACPQLAKANLGGPCLNKQITKKNL